MKITFYARNGDTITTTCAGTSQHKWDEISVHSPAKRGTEFLAKHAGEIIVARTKYGQSRVTEVTTAPLP